MSSPEDIEQQFYEALQQGDIERLMAVWADDDDQRRHGGGEAPGHQLPVPLHEGVGDHRLEQHHRGDDDDERAGVEPLRQPVADEAPAEDAKPKRKRATKAAEEA